MTWGQTWAPGPTLTHLVPLRGMMVALKRHSTLPQRQDINSWKNDKVTWPGWLTVEGLEARFLGPRSALRSSWERPQSRLNLRCPAYLGNYFFKSPKLKSDYFRRQTPNAENRKFEHRWRERCGSSFSCQLFGHRLSLWQRVHIYPLSSALVPACPLLDSPLLSPIFCHWLAHINWGPLLTRQDSPKYAFGLWVGCLALASCTMQACSAHQ